MKNFLLVLLMIIIVAGTGCAIYYQVDRFNKKTEVDTKTSEEQKEEKTEEKAEKLDVNSEQVTSLMKKVDVVNDFYSTGEQMQGYFYIKDKYTKNEIDDTIKLLIGLNSIDLKNRFERTNEYELGTVKLTALEVRNSIENVFGKDITYNDVKEKITMPFCAVGAVTFNSEDNSYLITEPGCGGTLNPYYSTKIISATKYENRIEIEEKAIYITANTENENNITTNIYKANKTDLIAENITTSDYDQYFDKTDSYKYTFKLEDENYYFESVEKIK